MNAYGQYQNAYRQASVNTMDQTKLILMLYDGAIKHVTIAIGELSRPQGQNVEKVHNSFVKSKNIISELMSSLNLEQGGEIATNLQSLYAFMFNQLIQANVEKKSEPAIEVLELLKDLKAAWTQIGKVNQTRQSPTTATGQVAKKIRLQG